MELKDQIREMEERQKLIQFMLSIFDPTPIGPVPDTPDQVEKWVQRHKDERDLSIVRKRIFARLKDI